MPPKCETEAGCPIESLASDAMIDECCAAYLEARTLARTLTDGAYVRRFAAEWSCTDRELFYFEMIYLKWQKQEQQKQHR